MISKDIYDSGQTFEQMKADINSNDPHKWDIATTMTLSEILYPDFHKRMMELTNEFEKGKTQIREKLGNELIKGLRNAEI